MNIALILSGGTGTRLGADIPKQYIKVEGRTILSFCLETLFCHEQVDAVQIVADSSWQKEILEEIRKLQQQNILSDDMAKKFYGFSIPGQNRQLSIFHGLTDILSYASEEDKVLIHDAARPCLSEKMISECFIAIEGHDGVLPVLPMKDTVYFSEEGKKIDSLLNRSQIFAGQAPEVFHLGRYYKANVALLPEKILSINGSTEPAILAGMDIVMISGDEGNFKITTKADLERFQTILGNS